MRVLVNPAAQASSEFSYAAPGDYTLRVKGIKEKKKTGGDWPYLEWQFEFADPNVKSVETDKQGTALPVGDIFEITTLKPDGQFALRNVCEALGLTWGDFDTDEVIGKEFEAKVGTEIYKNKVKNVIDKYIS